MDLVCNCLHATWKLFEVHFQKVMFVTSIGPAIVQYNIVITNISKTRVHEFCRGIKEERLGNVTAKGVPVVLQRG